VTARRVSEHVKIAPALPRGVQETTETADDAGLHVHPGWAADLPWIVQGVSGRPHDMSLFGGAPAGTVVPRWQQLRDRLLCAAIVHSRQVHADTVLLHDAVPQGVLIAQDADGHATRQPGILLSVSVADCVPVYMVAPDARAVALVHAGWRGAARGILESGVDALTRHLGAHVSDLHVHFGPAICGACYEVGAEVPRGLGVREVDTTHIDLRAHLAQRAHALGIAPRRMTVSSHCTRHDGSPFHSHRGGSAERQIAVLGMRAV
jgi:polyphenol oxidase